MTLVDIYRQQDGDHESLNPLLNIFAYCLSFTCIARGFSPCNAMLIEKCLQQKGSRQPRETRTYSAIPLKLYSNYYILILEWKFGIWNFIKSGDAWDLEYCTQF